MGFNIHPQLLAELVGVLPSLAGIVAAGYAVVAFIKNRK